VELKRNSQSKLAIQSKEQGRALYALALIVLIAVVSYAYASTTHLVITTDELVFAKISQSLPSYSSTANWLFDNEEFLAQHEGFCVNEQDRITTINAYTAQVWLHPPLAEYLVYPVLKIASNPVRDIRYLRIIPFLLTIITAVLLSDIIRRKWGYAVAALSIIPMVASQWLLVAGITFYNDCFMWLFFALSMWLIEVKPKGKWQYLTATAMVLSKLNAVVLLIPLLVLDYLKNKKVNYKLASTTFAIIVFFVYQSIVASDALYQVHHWMLLREFSSSFITTNVLPNIGVYALDWLLPLYIGLFLMVTYKAIKNREVGNLPYILFCLITFVFGFGWGFFGYQVFPITYSGMLMMAIIVSRLLDKDRGKRRGEEERRCP